MKRAFMVTYDLKGPSANYSGLYEFLKSQKNWWHYLKSTWIIITEMDASELADEILKFTKEDDRFLITSLSKQTQTNGWLPKKAWNWIHSRVDEVAALQS